VTLLFPLVHVVRWVGLRKSLRVGINCPFQPQTGLSAS
jgi:hypothetical protein